MNQSAGRPTWAEINLDSLTHNFDLIRERVGPAVKILAAVKANAYGHGAVQCAQRLEKEGADWFGVALPEEGIELRNAGVKKPILCLAGFWDGQESLCIQNSLTPVIYRLDSAETLNQAAKETQSIADVHIKIDTGMGRLGIPTEDVSAFCVALKRFESIRVDGLMTHLASADDQQQVAFTEQQLLRFEQAVAAFREHGFTPTYIHAANSAGLFAFPNSFCNLVRPGGTLYGFTRDVLPANLVEPKLRPVMSLYSRIILLKRVPKGARLGYGSTFETKRESLIATIPIGYDDGYRRAFSNKARVIVHGQFAPVVGRVSMDLTIIDVTEVAGVALNDRVTLLGAEGECAVTAEDLGELAGTISYEITCGISHRVPRRFV